MRKILIVFGGDSLEHDISVITGVLISNSIDKEKFEPIPCFIDKNGFWYIGKNLFDIGYFKILNVKDLQRVTLLGGEKNLFSVEKNQIKKLFEIFCIVNCVHGRMGEDGVVPAMAQLSNIPIVSPSILSSALTIDKDFCKKVLNAFGVLTVEGLTFNSRKYFKKPNCCMEEVEKTLGYPCIIKPCFGGSSIGVSVANDRKELSACLCKAFSFDDKILVEKFLEGAKEVNCAIYKKGENLIVSRCLEPSFSSKFFTFNEKYLNSLKDDFDEKPKSIDSLLEEKIKQITKKVYDDLELNCVVRIDYLCKDGKVYLNEINSVPGSFAFYAFDDRISSITGLLTDLIEEALSNFRRKNNVFKSFSSSVLNQKNLKSKK